MMAIDMDHVYLPWRWQVRPLAWEAVKDDNDDQVEDCDQTEDMEMQASGFICRLGKAAVRQCPHLK
jgi:hypothetical protein